MTRGFGLATALLGGIELPPLELLPPIALVPLDGESVQSVEIPMLAMNNQPTAPPMEGAEDFQLPRLTLPIPAFAGTVHRPLPVELRFCNPLDVASCAKQEAFLQTWLLLCFARLSNAPVRSSLSPPCCRLWSPLQQHPFHAHAHNHNHNHNHHAPVPVPAHAPARG